MREADCSRACSWQAAALEWLGVEFTVPSETCLREWHPQAPKTFKHFQQTCYQAWLWCDHPPCTVEGLQRLPCWGWGRYEGLE